MRDCVIMKKLFTMLIALWYIKKLFKRNFINI